MTEKRNFICTDIDRNSNKYWNIQLEDNVVTTIYGRVGNSKATDIKKFSSEIEARKYFNRKIRDKQKIKTRRDAYTEINILNESAKSLHISDIAISQIETTSSKVKDLIKWLSDINIHNIVQNTQISYNINEGSFSTPLGIVSQEDINEAKKLLDSISIFVESNSFDKDLTRLVNLYLRRIPSDIGGSSTKLNLKNIIGDKEKINKQWEIIEGLESAIGTATKIEDKVFNAKIELIEPTEEKICRLSNIRNVYSLEIYPVISDYKKIGATIGNNLKLWHGTNPANVLSIIKNGLILNTARPNGNHGAGLYFSDRHEKSLSYASSNIRNGKYTQFLFLSEVAAGNIYYGGGRSLNKGYHSLWYGKDSYDSQVVIYEKGRANLLYLIEIGA